MGGNALTVFTRRYNKTEYLQLQEELVLKLSELYNTVLTVPSYNNKQDYGDLDLIVNGTKINNIKEYLVNELNTKEIVSNGNCISFEYKEFQIDLIHINSNLVLAKTYFSYNDLGMLMGILAKRLHCKYGFDGLYYTYYNNDRSYKKDIFLTSSPIVIFNFLGLSYDRFYDGFNELTDIFDYVISSKYFDTSCFINEEEWNHIRRTRSRKRANWSKFIDYLNTNNIQISNPKLTNIAAYVGNYFSIDLTEQINLLDKEQEIKKLVKTKFNGVIVSELTGLVDKELGNFIKQFKDSKLDFNSYIVNTDIDNIKIDILLNYTND